MKSISIFNHVIGPVMRGPSSSHTAGAFHIASMAKALLAGEPRRAMFAFDPGGSYARTYAAQGADRAFPMGLMGRPLTDDTFFSALSDAAGQGLEIGYEVRSLARPDHPNSVEIELTSTDGTTLHVEARSVGGGEVELTRVADLPVLFNGASYELAMLLPQQHLPAAIELLSSDDELLGEVEHRPHQGQVLVTSRRKNGLLATMRGRLELLAVGNRVYESHPVYFVHAGQPLLASAAEMLAIAEQRGMSLGQLAMEYETQLLNLDPADVMQEILRRYDVMEAAARRGLERDFSGTQLLTPTASAVFAPKRKGGSPFAVRTQEQPPDRWP